MNETTHPLLDLGYWTREAPRPRMAVFTGAGLSQESGLATFRGTDGLWERHRVEDVCDGRTWRKNRERVEAFYRQRLEDSQAAQPHAGHRWCVEAERRGAVLITQNVDNLLERAGAGHAIHLHGRVDRRTCWNCSHEWPEALTQGPECPACGSQDTRTSVVFFNEPAPAYAIASRVIAGLGPQDVLVVMGTSGKVVNPLRWLTHPVPVWVVDPQPAPGLTWKPLTRVFSLPASQAGPALDQAWEEHLHDVGGKA